EGMVEVEEAGYRDWAAEGATELVALERVDGLHSVDVAEVVRGVEVAIADEPEQAAVVLVAAAAGNDVNDASRVLAVFGVVIAGLDAELLYGVRHGEWGVDVGVLVDVVAAIEEVVRLADSCAVCGNRDGYREGLSGTLISLCGRGDNDAGDKRCES